MQKQFNFSNLDDMIKNNIVFGAVTGDRSYIFLKEYYPDAKIIDFDSKSMVFEAFKAKIIDSFLSHYFVMKNFIEINNIKEYNSFEVKILEIDKKNNDLGFSFALNKKNTKLLNQINMALEEIKNNGEIDILKEKYGLQ